MFVITYRKIFYAITALLVVFSVLSFFVYGIRFGIDFTGGSLLEVSYPADTGRPAAETLKSRLDFVDLGEYSLRPEGTLNYTLRTRTLNPAEKADIIEVLSVDGFTPKEERFNSIGPVVGKELRNKAFVAIALAILGIVLFVTFAFRKVSEPVPSWKYGLATIIALAHDVLIPAGIFVAWSHYNGGDIDLLFVTALLAILGYSVHDTIVVFDRVREHLRINKERHIREDFAKTVGESISQTFGRSINTSLTIFFVLVALYFIGGDATRNFAFVLLVGVIVGTYSSIFLASPLLVLFEGGARKQKKK